MLQQRYGGSFAGFAAARAHRGDPTVQPRGALQVLMPHQTMARAGYGSTPS